MKNLKTIIIIVIILAVAVAAYFIIDDIIFATEYTYFFSSTHWSSLHGRSFSCFIESHVL